MNKRTTIYATGLLFALPLIALAKGEFLDTFISNYKISDSSKLAEKSCGICHVSEEDYSFNAYGKQLAVALLNSGAKELTPSIIRKVESKDADGDGFSNGDELKAGHDPADKNDKPAGEPTPKSEPAKPKPPVAATDTKAKPTTDTSTKTTDAKTAATTDVKKPEPGTTKEDEAAKKPDQQTEEENGASELKDEGEETAATPEETKPKSFIPKNGYHPAIVHFPIALFVAGLLLDLFGLITRKKELLLAGWYNLILAALTSIAGIVTGYLAMVLTKVPFKGVIQQHFLLAVVASFIMWMMVTLRVHRHEEMNVPMRAIYWLLALAGFALISWAGHLGGVYVYGE